MTTFLLIRHATNDAVGSSIAGRAPGTHLNSEGREQAEALGRRLAGVQLDAIYSSPLERTLETAQFIARGRPLSIEQRDDLLELDFGDWTGCRFSDLAGDPRWRRWNSARAISRIPGGETMLEIQTRAVSALLTIRDRWPDGRCAVVSHGDVIRGALAYVLGIPIDLMLRLEVRPASVSVVQIGADSSKVLCVNHAAELPVG